MPHLPFLPACLGEFAISTPYILLGDDIPLDELLGDPPDDLEQVAEVSSEPIEVICSLLAIRMLLMFSDVVSLFSLSGVTDDYLFKNFK